MGAYFQRNFCYRKVHFEIKFEHVIFKMTDSFFLNIFLDPVQKCIQYRFPETVSVLNIHEHLSLSK